MAYSNAVFFIDPENGNDTARTALTTTIASNPSGSITRMTKAAHGLTTGAVVTLAGYTAWLNGQWKITVVDADNFDLDTAVWEATADASGTVTPLGGSSMADAWQTFNGVSGLVGYGSTVRIKESEALVSPGNATWTDGSTTITWASAHNKVVCDCDDVWTASANITATSPLTASTKQGAGYCYLAPVTAFTTGKMAYFTLPATLDLSAFQQVSMWFDTTTARAAGFYTLKLCSDSSGDTPVHSFDFPALVNHYQAVVFDNGAALGSGINSIALYANSDPSTGSTRMDNVVACKAPGTSDCITHAHVITKATVGEPEMYAILSIGDSSVEIGGGYKTTVFSTGYLNRPYVGTTEAVATYTMTGFKLMDVGWDSSTKRTYGGASNTAANAVTVSGGWNRTDMTTQTSATYLNGAHYADYALNFSSKNYINLEKIGFLYCAYYGLMWSGVGFYGEFEQLVGNYYTAMNGINPNGNGPYYLGFTYMQGSNEPSPWGANYYSDARYSIVKGKRIHGSALDRASTVASGLQIRAQNSMYLDKLDNIGGYGQSDFSYNQYGVARLHGCTITDCYKAEVVQSSNTYASYLYDCTFSAPSFTNASDKGMARIFSSRHGGVDDDHRIYGRYFNVVTDATTRHTASGVSWKISPLEATTYILDASPAYFTLAKIAVEANALLTVKCWMRRNNTGIEAGIRLLTHNIMGGYVADIDTLMTAAADTWQEITLTFTPTRKGVVEILGIAWGGTTYSAWFDDLTITQA